MKEQKRKLRQNLKDRRRTGSGDPRETGAVWNAEVYGRAGLTRYKTLFSFLSFPSEPDTTELHALALEQGLIVAVPKVQGETMGFYQIEAAEGPFTAGSYGIREPVENAPVIWRAGDSGGKPAIHRIVWPLLVAVPGLAFSRDGRRLGRGGGYYDRFIANLFASDETQKALLERGKNAVTLMGICQEALIIPEIPVEDHDARVDCLLTEMDYIICEHISG